MTKQEKMKALLIKTGIPYKKIEVYGMQIMVTSHCQNTANRWHMLLKRIKLKKVRVPVESFQVLKSEEKYANSRKHTKVWLTGATI